MFFHLSPRKLHSFAKANQISFKNRDREMLLQATYIYEAFVTVMSNAFGKKKVDWRTKTYSEEYEYRNLDDFAKKKRALREFGADMDRRYLEFQRYKKQQESSTDDNE